jgi:G6PDH family F420-dependent oxidoreductase
MLREAVEIIRALHGGGYVSYDGRYYELDSARVWDLPDDGVPIGTGISGPASARLAGELADAMIATDPDPTLGPLFAERGGVGKPGYGQQAVCFDPDEEAARMRAREQFRWFGTGWKVNAELPGTSAFAAASEAVRAEDMAASIPCGSDVRAVLGAVGRFADASVTHLALLQVGGDHQAPFIEWAADEIPDLARAV